MLFFGHLLEYVIVPYKLEKCPVNGEELDYQLDLKENMYGAKALGPSMNLSETLNENCTYTAKVEVKRGSQYIEYTEVEGKACESLDNVMKPAWDRFKQETKPSVRGCIFNPNSYFLNEFQMKKDEVKVPIQAEGEFRAEMRLSCDNVEMTCVKSEFAIRTNDGKK
ncbi:hypothetical protein ABEB36_001159 [Hypothenemus hampei]|uniref:Uncharacterized protein n=1 Tax=Hypothenemus hampei TaxID=57062 RepID=A0ABD1FDR6_HYPHA